MTLTVLKYHSHATFVSPVILRTKLIFLPPSFFSFFVLADPPFLLFTLLCSSTPIYFAVFLLSFYLFRFACYLSLPSIFFFVFVVPSISFFVIGSILPSISFVVDAVPPFILSCRHSFYYILFHSFLLCLLSILSPSGLLYTTFPSGHFLIAILPSLHPGL